MNDKEKKAIEKIEKQILIGECEKAIGVPIYISDLKTILNLIENQKAEIDRLKNIISNTSVQFINDTIKTDKKNKEDIESLNEGWKIELEKKDRQLEEKTNRIKNLEKECQKYFDNMMDTIQENSKKDKQINLMAEELVKAHEWFYSEFDNYTKEDFIKYFEKKAEESK